MDVLRLPLVGSGGLFDELWRVPDPRARAGTVHPSRALIAAAICAVLSGARSFRAIAQWVKSLSDEQRVALGFKRSSLAIETAFRRFLNAVSGDRLSAVLGAWFERHVAQADLRVLAGDGKTLRGSATGATAAMQLASVVTHGSGVTVGQTVIEGGNEISALQHLLATLDIAGATITLDALHTQKDTATLIVQIKAADYVMIVKGNQPTMQWEIENAPTAAFSPGAHRERQGSWSHRDPPDQRR